MEPNCLWGHKVETFEKDYLFWLTDCPKGVNIIYHGIVFKINSKMISLRNWSKTVSELVEIVFETIKLRHLRDHF